MKHNSRWLYAVLGIMVLFFAGMVYAWSVLSTPIAQEYPQWSKAQLSLTFTIVMIMFCAGCMAGGMLSARLSARWCIWISAVLFLLGFVLAANMHSLLTLYVGFGVVCGFASGFSYNAVMGTIGKWFPDKQGLISGILLMGFGISSFVIGKLYQAWTPESVGAWRRSFLIFGLIAAVVLLVCGYFIKKPDAGALPAAQKKDRHYVNPVAMEAETKTMVKKPAFWLYYLWAILLSAAGLALVSQASGIAAEVGKDVSAGTIATVVGAISVANGVGRVILGGLFDRVGRSTIMQIVNAGFILTSLILMLALRFGSFPVIVAGFVVGGLAYGGVTPTNSAFVSSYYGMKNYPMNFSIVNTNLIIASFGSTIAGALYDLSQSYMSTYLMMGILAAAGIFASLAINACDKRALSRTAKR